jgi:hypothetical protein
MNIAWMRIGLGVLSLLAVARTSSAQNPQYQLLDVGEPVGGTGAFQFIPARLSSGGQVVAPVVVDGGRITREWDAQNGWRAIAAVRALTGT